MMSTIQSDTPQSSYKKRSRLKMIAFAAILFLSGVIVGSGVTLKVIINRAEAMIVNPELRYTTLTNRMHRRLGLTDEQTAKVQSVLKNTQSNLQAIRETTVPLIDQELSAMHQGIMEILTPEQASKWDKQYMHYYNKWFLPIKERAAQNSEQERPQR